MPEVLEFIITYFFLLKIETSRIVATLFPIAFDLFVLVVWYRLGKSRGWLNGYKEGMEETHAAHMDAVNKVFEDIKTKE